MRDFLDSILSFIGSESLTDGEFDGVEATIEDYTQEIFNELKAILEARENVSDQLAKLTHYFQAKGIEVMDTEKTPTSQIFIGAEL